MKIAIKYTNHLERCIAQIFLELVKDECQIDGLLRKEHIVDMYNGMSEGLNRLVQYGEHKSDYELGIDQPNIEVDCVLLGDDECDGIENGESNIHVTTGYVIVDTSSEFDDFEFS